MELYELNESTLSILHSLQTTGTQGRVPRERQSGKTTALLIHGKQLLDTVVQPGEDAIVFSSKGTVAWAQMRYQQLFPNADRIPLFASTLNSLVGRYGYLLFDEPYLLGWSEDTWNAVRTCKRFVIKSVGSW